jgi:hypothetical protein
VRADRPPDQLVAGAEPLRSATISFAGAPDFSPTRIAVPGPDGFPLAKFQPGAMAGPGYSPFIRIAGSDVVYNAPIVAVGNGPFDVVNHTNTADRVLGIHIGKSPADSPSGQFSESWVDMLFVKGFDAGQPTVYLSTDAGQPLTAVLERSTYVPAPNDASCNGCDDFLDRPTSGCSASSTGSRAGRRWAGPAAGCPPRFTWPQTAGAARSPGS